MNIIEFKKSNLFEKYDCWIDSMIIENYAFPAFYDDDGNMLSDDIFYKDDYEKAREEILDISFQIYDKIAYGRLFESHSNDLHNCKDVDYVSIVADMIRGYDHNDYVLLGTVYYLFVYDYPNYKPVLGNRYIVKRSYNELFTRVFVRISYIDEWLHLYSSLLGITYKLELPKALQTETVLTCLMRLREMEILDDNYKFTPRAKAGAWRYLIAKKLNWKGCSYAVLEKHFGVSNLRDSRSFDAFENRKSKQAASSSEIQLYNSINNCFRQS